jgi:hypothetical protein
MHQKNLAPPFKRVIINIAGIFPDSERMKRQPLIAADCFTNRPKVYVTPNHEASPAMCQ